MKLTGSKKQDVLSNNSDETMNFDIGDVSVIIEILRNRLYSNPIQTLTQEYLSNGRDATRESGNNRPLRVTLPTGLDSVLKIRDYGVGLSPQRVKEVFVLYGASTKRTDNNQTGGFGIGAKSAWAYTDSFTVVSYYNGTMYTYIAHTGENANGIFEKMGEEATAEPNGVEVQIPVKLEHREQFIMAVYRSTLFWPVKPVFAGITEAEIPSEYKDFFKKVTHQENNWKIILNNDFYKKVLGFGYGFQAQVVLSVDGIPYPLNKFYAEPSFQKLLTAYSADSFMVLEVTNGDVEVSATREAVSDKEHSKKNIVAKVEEVNSKLAQYIEKKSQEPQSSLFDYMNHYNSIVKGFNRTFWPKFHYAVGERVFKVNNFRALEIPQGIKFQTHRYNLRSVRGGKVNMYTEEAFIDLNRNNIFFVVRDNDDSLNKTKEKIRALIDKQAETLKISKDLVIYLLQDFEVEQQEMLVKEFKAFKLSELTYEAVKRESKKKSNDKINVRFISYEGDRSWSREYVVKTQDGCTFDQLNANNAKYVIVPFSSEDMYSKDSHRFLHTIRFLKAVGGYHVVKLSNRDYRLAKENLDNVVEYTEVIKKLPEYVKLPALKEEQIRARIRFQSNLNHLAPFGKGLKDEGLKDFVANTTLQAPHNAVDPDIEIFIQEQYEVYTKAKADYDRRLAEENVFYTRYPILKQMDWRGMKVEVVAQLIEFINFVYDQRNKVNEEKKKKKT